ncbi:MAG: magnesium transporter CorA family protein [Candidatus Parcubacteria bacterium]|nr:magnesium transporter CorA family protein [Candidatus Parcubacteria bacterium]
MPQSQIIKTSKLSWLNITNASEKEISYLRKKFKFDQLDLADSYAHKHAQRPKINIRPNYLFIILLFPVYRRKTREIIPAEVDIFITKDHLITLHYNQLEPLQNFFQLCQADTQERNTYLNEGSLMLLYEILDRLYFSQFPMLDHISIDINNIEKNIFAGQERAMVKEILVVKRNIVFFRQIMQSHRNVLIKLIKHQGKTNGQNRMANYFNDLIDRTHNIWDLLENFQQTINALEDTNSSLVTFKLNDIMRTLTIFSVIVFPLTLMAAVFGMNVKNIPIAGTDFDFYKIIAIMGTASLAMFLYFKHKKWI